MKRSGILFAGFLFLLFTGMLYAQQPPNPGWGNDPNPVGGGAPLGGGLAALLVMGAGYAVHRIYQSRKKLQD